MAIAPVIKQRANTMYDNMVFEPVEYAEFPMAVPVRNGVVQSNPYDAKHKPYPVVIVESQEELDALMGDAPLVPINPGAPDSPMRVESEDDIRTALYIQADQLGVQIDKRWTVGRIEDTIKTHLSAKAGGDVV